MPVPPQPDAALFPIFLSLSGTRVVVVGGGEAALAKLRLLRRSGAALIVVDPAPHDEIVGLAATGRLELRRRSFVGDDLDGAILCYAALDDVDEATAVVAEARRRRVLVNAVDRPALCDFMTPAIVERGPVTIAISTGGVAPALARELRARIETTVPPAYGTLAAFCGRWRARVAKALEGSERRRRFWTAVVGGREAIAVLAGDEATAEALIADRLALACGADLGEIGAPNDQRRDAA